MIVKQKVEFEFYVVGQACLVYVFQQCSLGWQQNQDKQLSPRVSAWQKARVSVLLDTIDVKIFLSTVKFQTNSGSFYLSPWPLSQFKTSLFLLNLLTALSSSTLSLSLQTIFYIIAQCSLSKHESDCIIFLFRYLCWLSIALECLKF